MLSWCAAMVKGDNIKVSLDSYKFKRLECRLECDSLTAVQQEEPRAHWQWQTAWVPRGEAAGEGLQQSDSIQIFSHVHLSRFGRRVCSPDTSTWLLEARELNVKSCSVVEFALQSDTARCQCECNSLFPWRVWHIPLLPLHGDRWTHAAPPPPMHAQSKSLGWLEVPTLPSKAMHKTFGLFPAKFMHLGVIPVLINFIYITVTFPYRQEWQTQGV